MELLEEIRRLMRKISSFKNRVASDPEFTGLEYHIIHDEIWSSALEIRRQILAKHDYLVGKAPEPVEFVDRFNLDLLYVGAVEALEDNDTDHASVYMKLQDGVRIAEMQYNKCENALINFLPGLSGLCESDFSFLYGYDYLRRRLDSCSIYFDLVGMRRRYRINTENLHSRVRELILERSANLLNIELGIVTGRDDPNFDASLFIEECAHARKVEDRVDFWDVDLWGSFLRLLQGCKIVRYRFETARVDLVDFLRGIDRIDKVGVLVTRYSTFMGRMNLAWKQLHLLEAEKLEYRNLLDGEDAFFSDSEDEMQALTAAMEQRRLMKAEEQALMKAERQALMKAEKQALSSVASQAAPSESEATNNFDGDGCFKRKKPESEATNSQANFDDGGCLKRNKP